MPTQHYPVPKFYASGTGRDLYLDPRNGQGSQDDGALKRAHRRTIRFRDFDSDAEVSLRWWSHLPAGGEFKSRIQRERAMASRLSSIHPGSKSKSRTRLTSSLNLTMEERLALEKFNPFSPHQRTIRDFSVLAASLVTRPS
ncbi:hypothetical protein GUITHDRAFT_122031 [Guillardia theta CCMP2712]|uniref:Uncharacterized protein n=1 Tax=Guillardia theta (strain CCMP2712) TaxID=905079 RepID=L1I6V9_GUITC|nr:hypothetical protein GUITHDRAFT_122031 [Guillardia theta CCMP2712]EKX31787.1 hypothetical protein GUITHDRAFT_122031 [Guillardia theta CCMP2712]|eukprot:XP_005818767.1 hypothetical protein GUITHDRAFT_122031 [Guillardia theta CCMP2712]